MLRLSSIFSNLLPIVFFLLYKKRNQERKLWVIFVYTCISFLVDISYKTIATSVVKQLDVYSFFTGAEYLFFSLFFYYTYQRKIFQQFIIGCTVLFYIIILYNLHYSQINYFDTLPASTEAVFIVIFSILYFYEQINDPSVTFLYATKSFWIIIAILLYLSVSLFPFIARAVLQYTDTDSRIIDYINNTANIIKNILFAFAFRMQGAKYKS